MVRSTAPAGFEPSDSAASAVAASIVRAEIFMSSSLVIFLMFLPQRSLSPVSAGCNPPCFFGRIQPPPRFLIELMLVFDVQGEPDLVVGTCLAEAVLPHRNRSH